MTNNQQKILQQLQRSKFRKEFGCFVVEGTKMVRELCLEQPAQIEWIAATPEWISENGALLCNAPFPIIETTSSVLKTNSSLQTSPLAIAVVKQMPIQPIENQLFTGVSLFLETIQDPGNLGTIIRTADWFGIKNIVCSPNTVDCFNPKVVQSSMGSLCNAAIYYTEMDVFLSQATALKINTYGTLLNGKNIKDIEFSSAGILLLGNEANGIDNGNQKYITHPITIQKANTAYAESLNVSIAAAICCSRW